MITRDELIKIGTFNKPHALKGEISFTFTDDIFDRSECPYIVCEIDGIFVPFFIDEYRFRGEDTALVKLEDVDTDDEARMFTGVDVYFPKSWLTDDDDDFAAPGDFFIGFTVVDSLYGTLGRIVDVDDTTANTLFVVERVDGSELLIPANDDFVVAIDSPAHTITMNIPEGLLSL